MPENEYPGLTESFFFGSGGFAGRHQRRRDLSARMAAKKQEAEALSLKERETATHERKARLAEIEQFGVPEEDFLAGRDIASFPSLQEPGKLTGRGQQSLSAFKGFQERLKTRGGVKDTLTDDKIRAFRGRIADLDRKQSSGVPLSPDEEQERTDYRAELAKILHGQGGATKPKTPPAKTALESPKPGFIERMFQGFRGRNTPANPAVSGKKSKYSDLSDEEIRRRLAR